MNSFNKTYLTNHSRGETIRMIDFIYRKLLKDVNESFELINVSPPLFDALNSNSILNFKSTTRSINIDLVDDYRIITFYQSLSRWAQKSLINYEIKEGEGILFLDNSIWRDLIPHSKISQHKSYLHIEIFVNKETEKATQLKEITNKIYEIIFNMAEEVQNKYKINNIFPKDIQFIESQLLENEFPNLSFESRESEISKDLKSFILMESGKVLLSGNVHSKRSTLTYDNNYYNEIHLLDEVDGNSINVASIAFKLWGDSLVKQLAKSSTKDIHENLLLKEICENKKYESIEIRINLFKLYMVILKKGHIAEVQPNVLSKEVKNLKSKNMIEAL